MLSKLLLYINNAVSLRVLEATQCIASLCFKGRCFVCVYLSNLCFSGLHGLAPILSGLEEGLSRSFDHSEGTSWVITDFQGLISLLDEFSNLWVSMNESFPHHNSLSLIDWFANLFLEQRSR